MAKSQPSDSEGTLVPGARAPDDKTLSGPAACGEETVLHRPSAAPLRDETLMLRPNQDDETVVHRAASEASEPRAFLHEIAQSAEELAEPDADATALFIPTPGRRRPLAPATPGVAAAPANADAAEEQLATLAGLNPLVAAANRLLSAVPQIRGSLRHTDPPALRDGLVSRIREFETDARGKGHSERSVAQARYALCALIDESALHTPWGSGAHWENEGLLQRVEGEPPGSIGDKFFDSLEEAEKNPAANLEMLEFLAVCLALGFEGRFRITASARMQLEPVREKLQGLIKAQRGSANGLSLRWKGLEVPMRRRSPWFGTWVSACVCAAVLVGVYLGLRVLLATSAEPAARELASLRAKVEPVAATSQGHPLVARLKADLDKEIREGTLILQEDGVKSVVTISGDELFTSGSDLIEQRYVPTVLRVAQALDKVPGTITIAGHTDDKPIRSARFPSNWDLSRERAITVMKMMSGELGDPGRLRAEGLADSEPLAPNDSVANRARNRRVTMILRVTS